MCVISSKAVVWLCVLSFYDNDDRRKLNPPFSSRASSPFIVVLLFWLIWTFHESQMRSSFTIFLLMFEKRPKHSIFQHTSEEETEANMISMGTRSLPYSRLEIFWWVCVLSSQELRSLIWTHSNKRTSFDDGREMQLFSRRSSCFRDFRTRRICSRFLRRRCWVGTWRVTLFSDTGMSYHEDSVGV